MGYPIQAFSGNPLIYPAKNSDGNPIYGDEFKSYISTQSFSFSAQFWMKGPTVPGSSDSIVAHIDGTIQIKSYGTWVATGTFYVKVNGSTVLTINTASPNYHWYDGSTKMPAVYYTFDVLAGDVVTIENSTGTKAGMVSNYASGLLNYDNRPEITAGWP